MKDTSFLSAATHVRALERSLLNRERMERMLEARSFEEAAKVLVECGYEPPSETGVEAMLTEARQDTYAAMTALAPAEGGFVTDFFALRYDYHNLKVLLKSEKQDAVREDLLLSCGRVKIKSLVEAYSKQSLTDWPPAMARAAQEGRELLDRTGDPQITDFHVDRAMAAEMRDIAQSSGSSFLLGYAVLFIDAANLRAATRAVRLGRSADFLRFILSKGGHVDTARVMAAVSAGTPLADLYVAGPLEEAAALAAPAMRGEGSLTAFERAADDALMAYLRRARMIPFGEQALVGFLGAREAEHTAIRTILSGRLAGVAPEAIRERLRELY